MKLQVRVLNSKKEFVDIKEMIEGIDYSVISINRIELLRDILITVNGFAHTIKAGFTYNGASIPRLFWSIIGKPTDQKFALASLVHDYLYMIKYNRDVADAAFRKLLDWAGVNGRKVALMWGAVRLFGHAFYASRANNNRWTTKFWRYTVKKLYGSDE